jgi:hypothetical protein
VAEGHRPAISATSSIWADPAAGVAVAQAVDPAPAPQWPVAQLRAALQPIS